MARKPTARDLESVIKFIAKVANILVGNYFDLTMTSRYTKVGQLPFCFLNNLEVILLLPNCFFAVLNFHRNTIFIIGLAVGLNTLILGRLQILTILLPLLPLP